MQKGKTTDMEIGNLPELRQYIRQRLAYYEFPASDLEHYDQSMEYLINRHNDPNLYLGIVGEFSTGKSTFINALLGMEILKEDILPGTTCAPTYLCHGKSFKVDIYSIDGRLEFTYNGCKKNSSGKTGKCSPVPQMADLVKEIEKARSFIHKYTAEENNAKSISKVVISLPCENQLFKAGIVIVDTPGINASERHQRVASDTVKQACDLAIVVIPATRSCSTTLMNFIDDSLEQSQEYCIGLITLMDQIKAKERKQVISFVKSRLNSEDVKFQDVFAVSPYSILHADEFRKNNEAEEFQDEFHQMVEQISKKIKKQKKYIIQQKLQNLIRSIMLEQLSPFFTRTQDELQNRYTELCNNRLGNFSDFITTSRKTACDAVLHTKPSIEEISQIAREVRLALEEELNNGISSAASKAELKNATASETIQLKLEIVKSVKLDLKIEALRRRILAAARNAHKQFAEEFNREFRNLGKHNESATSLVISNSTTALFDWTNIGSDSVGHEIDRQKTTMLGGALVGGIFFGALCASGLIGVIGAAVVGGLAALFGKSLPELKKEARVQMHSRLVIWENELTMKISGAIDKMIGDIYIRLQGAMEQYRMYQSQIEELIRTERNQQASLKRQITKIEKDLQLLHAFASAPSKLLKTA
jgi:GTPase Era involved in 16S rRNA processing